MTHSIKKDNFSHSTTCWQFVPPPKKKKIRLTKREQTKPIFHRKRTRCLKGLFKIILKLRTSVISIMPLTCWQASPPSANTSMKTSWGHGKFVAKKRRPRTALIGLRPVTIVAICSPFPPAKKIIESEITSLSWFKSEGRVCDYSLHHNSSGSCLYSLWSYFTPWSSLATSAPRPPDKYGPSNHLPHLIKTPISGFTRAIEGHGARRGSCR